MNLWIHESLQQTTYPALPFLYYEHTCPPGSQPS